MAPTPGPEHPDRTEERAVLLEEVHVSDYDSDSSESSREEEVAGKSEETVIVIPEKGDSSVGLSKSGQAEESPGCKRVSSSSSDKEELALCRICLEEDTQENLEVPCSCTGTQRHAHHDCIQKWVAEKGHLRCEICHQDYTVDYDVPPPPPPAPAPVFQPMYIVDGDGVARTVISNGTHVVDVTDDNERYNRHPGAQWGMTLMLFFMFMVLLHPTDPDDGEYNWPPAPPPPPPRAPGQDPYADSLPLFLLAVLIKILFIAIPMMMVLRIAARGAAQQQYEVRLRASAYDAAMTRQRTMLGSGGRYESTRGV